MKRSNWFVALMLVFCLVLPTVAFAKGGGGGGRGGGFSGGSRSFSSSSKSYSSGSKSFSSSSKSYTKTTKTYTNAQGKTISYTPKTYASSPRTYTNSSYYGGRTPVNYYYTNSTGSDIWFWLWLTGRNEHGTDAPQAAAVQAPATNDAGVESTTTKARAVPVPTKSVWSEYSTEDIIAIALIWILGLGGIAWLATAGIRAFMGKQFKFRFWKADENSYRSW